MEIVTDYFPEITPEEGVFRTRVWATDQARKELEHCVDPNLASVFRSRANKGFQGYFAPALRKEGDGVWAFGPRGTTGRICGYFLDENTRKNFVVGGAWKGKDGSGPSRPPEADAIVERVESMRTKGVDSPIGVLCATQAKAAQPTGTSAKGQTGQALLRTQPPRRSSPTNRGRHE